MISIQSIGAVNVIKVRSSLQDECLEQCRRSVEDCLGNGRRMLVLNLNECPLVNSEGLEFIVDAQQDCLGHGGKLVIAEPKSLCSEILAITGIEQHVSVYRDMRGALSDFAR